MFWLVVGGVIGIVLIAVPQPLNVAPGFGLLLGVRMHTSALLEQLLGRVEGRRREPVRPDPDTLPERLARARLAPRRKDRIRRKAQGGR